MYKSSRAVDGHTSRSREAIVYLGSSAEGTAAMSESGELTCGCNFRQEKCMELRQHERSRGLHCCHLESMPSVLAMGGNSNPASSLELATLKILDACMVSPTSPTVQAHLRA